MKKYEVLVLCLLSSLLCLSQGEDRNLFTRGGYSNLESRTGVNDVFGSISDRRYYDTESSDELRIILDNDQVTNVVPGRIDFNNETVDVEVGVGGIAISKDYFKIIDVYRTLDNSAIDTLTYVNSGLIFNDKKSRILQVLSKGEKVLLKHLEVKFVKSNYNKALNIGNKEDSFRVKETYYYFINDKLVEVPFKSRKMSNFIEKYSLGANSNFSVNSEVDLVKLFTK